MNSHLCYLLLLWTSTMMLMYSSYSITFISEPTPFSVFHDLVAFINTHWRQEPFTKPTQNLPHLLVCDQISGHRKFHCKFKVCGIIWDDKANQIFLSLIYPKNLVMVCSLSWYVFFLAGVCSVSRQPPKMDSYPFRTRVAPVILTIKCLGMDVATVNVIFHVCRSVLHIGIAVLIFI